jgi:hypothetical protein
VRHYRVLRRPSVAGSDGYRCPQVPFQLALDLLGGLVAAPDEVGLKEVADQLNWPTGCWVVFPGDGMEAEVRSSGT